MSERPADASPAPLPTVAILAGGLATRLRPVTGQIPKSMVEIAGEPFIAHQLRLLRRRGADRIVLCLGHLGEQVRDFVGDGRRFGLEVAYSFDGPVLLGTGGALRHALPQLDDRVIVLYGDSYLDVALYPVVAAFEAAGHPALMTVMRNRGQWDASNARLLAGGRVRYDKKHPDAAMDCIDYGLGVIARDVLASFRDLDQPFDLADFYHSLSVAGQLAGLEMATRFYEIGSFIGIAETERYLIPAALKVEF